MCTTLPPVLVTVLGIEKLVPTFADLEVFLQLLPRSSTGERMNPYTSLWTGVTPGDGPQELHVVLLDNGRTRVLARRGRPAGAALHPLLGVPQHLPRLLAHRRPRVRLGLPRPDRRDPDAAAVGHRARVVAAVRVEPLRRLLRGLPGQDRHPDGAAAPARGRPCGAGLARASARRCAPAAWVFGSPRRLALAQRLGAARAAAVHARRDDPPPAAAARRLDATRATCGRSRARASTTGGRRGERRAHRDPRRGSARPRAAPSRSSAPTAAAGALAPRGASSSSASAPASTAPRCGASPTSARRSTTSAASAALAGSLVPRRAGRVAARAASSWSTTRC